MVSVCMSKSLLRMSTESKRRAYASIRGKSLPQLSKEIIISWLTPRMSKSQPPCEIESRQDKYASHQVLGPVRPPPRVPA